MQRYFLFLDTETNINEKNDQQKQTLKLGWCIFYDRVQDTHEYFFFDTHLKFWSFVFSKLKQIDYLTIFAHNMDFDYKIINAFRYLIKYKQYKSEKFYIEGHTFIVEFSKNIKTILFLDTMNYVPLSLKKIGESLKIPKLEIDFNKCSTEELKEYCKNDVKIIFEFVKLLLNFLSENDLSKLKPTIGSLALNIFRHRFYSEKNNPIYCHKWIEAEKIERDSYRGGICDCFKIVKDFKEQLYKLDINSMYPYIMKTKMMPTKLIYYGDYKHISEIFLKQELIKKLMSKNKHIIAHVKIKLPVEYSYILVKGKINKEKKSLFVSGEFETVLTTPELLFVYEYGKILNCYRLAIYDKSYIFNEFVDFFYDKRNEFKKDGNEAYSLFCKLILNSLYGKFGQTKIDRTLINDNADTNKVDKIVAIIDGKRNNIEQFGKYVYLLDKSSENCYDTFVAIPSFVTAYARMYLVDLILKAKRENVFYVDTDCLIVNEIGYSNLSDSINEYELGKLKIEGISNDTTIYRPKFYYFNNEKKCKGVKKDAEIIYLNGNVEVYKQLQFQKLKTSMKNHTSNKQIVNNITKIIDKRYDKGIVKDNEVLPYVVK